MGDDEPDRGAHDALAARSRVEAKADFRAVGRPLSQAHRAAELARGIGDRPTALALRRGPLRHDGIKVGLGVGWAVGDREREPPG